MTSHRKLASIVLSVVVAGVLLSLLNHSGDVQSKQDYGRSSHGTNVVLISVDTLRHDHLETYGYTRENSPNLKELSEESIIFKNHIAPMSLTLPSHTSMMTGLYPKSHGILKNGYRLNRSITTLAEILQSEGYVTAGVVASSILGRKVNFDQGFDYYYQPKPYADDAVKNGSGRYEISSTSTTDASKILNTTIKWLNLYGERHEETPFFLFIHFYDPHAGYRPPKKYWKWGNDKVSRYDGEILYVDEAIGKILKHMKTQDVYDNTIVIMTSDHGESLGERNYWGHEDMIYENCVHVPMIVKIPGLGKKVIEYQTTHNDILPSVINLLNIDKEIDSDGLDFFGEKIRNRTYIFGQRKFFKDYKTREVEAWYREYGNRYFARTNKYKYHLLTNYKDEFYKLGSDPSEKNNIIGKKPNRDKAKKYKKAIKTWLATEKKFNTESREIDEETKKVLESLGYIN